MLFCARFPLGPLTLSLSLGQWKSIRHRSLAAVAAAAATRGSPLQVASQVAAVDVQLSQITTPAARRSSGAGVLSVQYLLLGRSNATADMYLVRRTAARPVIKFLPRIGGAHASSPVWIKLLARTEIAVSN